MQRFNENYSLVRILHAVPEGDAVDIYFNGVPFYKGVTFGQFSPYIYVPGGEYEVTIFNKDTVENPIINEKVNIGMNELITIAVLKDDNNVKFLNISEEKEAPLGITSLVRVINLISNYPDIDIKEGDRVLYDDISFGETTEYIDLEARNYNLEILASDTDRLIGRTQVNVKPNRVYTLYLVGNAPNISLIQSVDGASFLI